MKRPNHSSNPPAAAPPDSAVAEAQERIQQLQVHLSELQGRAQVVRQRAELTQTKLNCAELALRQAEAKAEDADRLYQENIGHRREQLAQNQGKLSRAELELANAVRNLRSVSEASMKRHLRDKELLRLARVKEFVLASNQPLSVDDINSVLVDAAEGTQHHPPLDLAFRIHSHRPRQSDLVTGLSRAEREALNESLSSMLRLVDESPEPTVGAWPSTILTFGDALASTLDNVDGGIVAMCALETWIKNGEEEEEGVRCNPEDGQFPLVAW